MFAGCCVDKASLETLRLSAVPARRSLVILNRGDSRLIIAVVAKLVSELAMLACRRDIQLRDAVRRV